MKTWRARITGTLSFLTLAWYIPWLIAGLNWQAPWLSIPFAIASVLMACMIAITVINHWHDQIDDLEPLSAEEAVDVAVIVPTYGEPVKMVEATVRSVLSQDYPNEHLQIIISDDGHRLSMREMVTGLKPEYPDATLLYHEPPRRGEPTRRGEAKAGNLNSALDLVNSWDRPPRFVETRDADDCVGDPRFLTATVGHLRRQDEVAYVQTIKEAEVSPGDPFGNQEQLFYRQAMFSRNAANAVFPCGSGLVWRRAALLDIGGFPVWNLVEDLQSGIEALRRGWRGTYLPLVGAVGQVAPEDMANTVKQRGTWAIDTMRIIFWGDKRGLSLRQKLQFSELGIFYLMSFAVLIFAITPVLALGFHIYPMITTHTAYAWRFWPLAVAIELLMVSLAGDLPFESLWRARQTWLGMAPVYARATLLALRYGPNKKPAYRVTRKQHVYRWYWREVLPQLLLFISLIAASIYHILNESVLVTADLGSLFWAAYFVIGLSRTIKNSWHGLTFRNVIPFLAHRRASPAKSKQAVRVRSSSD